jgi:RimJ/RimL family protein N-acetyltransferase
MFSSLHTDRLLLRTLEPGDGARMFRYRSDPKVSHYQTWEPQSVDEIQAFIHSLAGVEHPEPGEWFQVVIVFRETGALIGDCGIHVSEADRLQAEIGISLDPVFQRRGLASEALQALFGYLFSGLGMHRVFGSVDPRNSPSMALLKRAGMRQEAYFVESCWSKGEWTDDAIFAILKREWESARNQDIR